MKRLLVITYYWHPAGGVGVQRVLKFTKYLPSFGWQPIIATAKNAHYPQTDNKLIEQLNPPPETIRIPIWEPYNYYAQALSLAKGLTKRNKANAHSGTSFVETKATGGITSKVAKWIRGNLFIPDARRFWIAPASKQLIAYLHEHPVDAIFSTGPPHTTHLIAKNVAQATNTPWLADFRDPWTEIDYLDDLMLSKHAKQKHQHLEQSVLQTAHAVTCVSPHWSARFSALGNGVPVHTITNAYDPADFYQQATKAPTKSAKFTISHTGTLNKARNPEMLWQALSQLCHANASFSSKLQIQLTGSIDYRIKQQLAQYGLTKHTNISPNLSHQEVIQQLISTQLLFLVVAQHHSAQGRIPLKLFEYIGAQRPIIYLGPPTGDAAAILQASQAGQVFTELNTLKKQILKWFTTYQTTGHIPPTAVKQLEHSPYSHTHTTKQLAQLLNSISQHPDSAKSKYK